MKINKSPVWLVWEWRPEEVGKERIWMACLRSIDRKKDYAKRHKQALESHNETFEIEARIVIEKVPTNHLYGYEDSNHVRERQVAHLVEELRAKYVEKFKRE